MKGLTSNRVFGILALASLALAIIALGRQQYIGCGILLCAMAACCVVILRTPEDKE